MVNEGGGLRGPGDSQALDGCRGYAPRQGTEAGLGLQRRMCCGHNGDISNTVSGQEE